MRIRSTKPEFWKSNTIAELSWDERLVLKGLESYVDDNGVGKDDIELICSEIFPRDTFRNPRETLARVLEAISNIISAGLVARYEVDGEKLLYIDKWSDIQRVDKPNRGRFRRPDGTLEYSETVNRDSYRNPREDFANPPEVLAPGTGEQGNRGTDKKPVGATEVCHQGADSVAPPRNCPDHLNDPNPPDCGGCAAQGRIYKTWKNNQALTERNELDAKRRQRQAAIAALRDCPLCDEHGWVLGADGTPVEPGSKCTAHGQESRELDA